MSFLEEKRQQIKYYMLEKIEQCQPSVVKKTAELFGTTPATIYKYLNEMEADGIIKKIMRDKYELVSHTFTSLLLRSDGELYSETKIYNKHILPNLTDLPKNVVGIWDYLCGEMINNVIDHSEAEHLELELTINSLYASLRLTDDGVGIFEKIKNHFNLETVDEAVGELFKGKVTTDERHHSGEGIFFSSRLADTFIIFSSGRIFTHNRFDGDSLSSTLHASESAHAFGAAGTTVYMKLSNNSQKQAKDIFDIYADVDGCFTKTTIPLQNYFESAPVSRSQAKRLCSRLEHFNEVGFDFQGLSWMGQGFAHQVFVVFQNEHPDIRLLPVNMNEDVRKMYVHVTGNTKL